MSAKSQVCLVDSASSAFWNEIDIERGVLGDVAEVSLIHMDELESALGQIKEADALIVAHHPGISHGLLELLRKTRVIVRNGVGYDNVDVEAARNLGIPVCNVPDYGTEEVADHALLLTLALQRRLSAALNDVQAGRWSWQAAVPGRRIRGQTFGIVGCGRIGTATALRAKAFGFQVQFFDPYLPSGYEKALALDRLGTLEELLQSSDVVSLHTPLNSETSGMIGDPQFALMKRGAFLINTARGPLVKEKALIAALRNRRLGGVGLDVLEREPIFDRELLDHPNCLITPHMAFYSSEALREMRTTAARIALAVLEGGSPANVVNGVAERREIAV